VNDNRFFKTVWRINALLVMCALVLFIGKSIYDEFQRRSRQTDYYAYNNASYATNEKGDIIIKDKWAYGSPSEVTGVSVFVFPLFLVGDPNKSESAYQIRNLAFVDNSLGYSKWLLPDNQKIILSYEFVESKDRDTVLAILYEILDKGADKASIYLSQPNGETFTLIIANVDRRMGQATIVGNYVIVFYIKEGTAYSTRIDLSSFSVVDNIALPVIK
jgi:hypothetical protein